MSARSQVKVLLTERLDQLHALAGALLEHETLNATQIKVRGNRERCVIEAGGGGGGDVAWQGLRVHVVALWGYGGMGSHNSTPSETPLASSCCKMSHEERSLVAYAPCSPLGTHACLFSVCMSIQCTLC